MTVHKTVRCWTAIFALLMLCAIPAASLGQMVDVSSEQDVDAMWTRAEMFERQQRWAEAEEVYAEILAVVPDLQKAAIKHAICQFQTGRASQAVDSMEQAVAMQPYSDWADMGLYYHVLACQSAGCPDMAASNTMRLKGRFPGSIWTARVEALERGVEDAANNPTGTQTVAIDGEAAASQLYRELEADEAYWRARSIPIVHDGDNSNSVAAFDAIITDYADTRTALRAIWSKGYALMLTPDSESAIEAFEEVITQLESTAPNSALVDSARFEIAGVVRRSGNKEEGLDRYLEVAESTFDDKMRADALMQAAATHFELLVDRQKNGQQVADTDWAQVRSRCNQVKLLDYATTANVITVDMVAVESLAWQLDAQGTINAAEQFLATYDAPEYDRDAAAAHLLIGEFLQRQGRHEEALPHYEWIVSRFGVEELWPEGTLIQRAHFRIYDALLETDALESELQAAGDEVLNVWPESYYADLVRNARALRGK